MMGIESIHGVTLTSHTLFKLFPVQKKAQAVWSVLASQLASSSQVALAYLSQLLISKASHVVAAVYRYNWLQFKLPVASLLAGLLTNINNHHGHLYGSCILSRVLTHMKRVRSKHCFGFIVDACLLEYRQAMLSTGFVRVPLLASIFFLTGSTLQA